MCILYKNIGFVISLEKKSSFSRPIPFLFRSIIGYQLRKMCCFARNSVCADCMFNATCIYGLAFESIVPKNNTVLKGRNRISHPFVIGCNVFTGRDVDSLILNIVFLGSTISYLPYFYYAIKMGGEKGLGRERVPYNINDVIEINKNGKTNSIVIDEEHIDTQTDPEKWEYNPETETEIEKSFMITLLSPLRYKTRGHYAHKIIESEFAACLHRRAQVLCSQYGHNDYKTKYSFSGNWNVTESNVKWKDYTSYSTRQKSAMLLGGMAGNFVLSGKFSAYEYSLLQFAELFHGGKNTNFGLGKLALS